MDKPKKIDPYSTHLPVLKRIFDVVKVRKVFEFGPGPYSTKFFSERAKDLISIEQSRQGWSEVMQEQYPGAVFLFEPEWKRAVELLAKTRKEFDLVFVDGAAQGRWACVNAAFDKAEIIVAHDTDAKEMYQWNRVKMPKGWQRFDYAIPMPATSVWTKNKELIKALKPKQRRR